MRIEQLELFLQVIESGSFAAAARIQHMSQPAVSMSVAALETEFGTKLLVRTPGQRRQIEATEAGMILMDYAKKALVDYHNAYTAVMQAGRTLKPVVLMTSYGPGACVTPQLVKYFKDHYAGIPLQVTPINGNSIYQSLLGGGCSVAISATAPPEGVYSEPFFRDPLVLICPSVYKIRSPLTLPEVQELPLIIRNKNSGAYQMFLDALSGQNMSISDFSVSMEVFGNSDILQAVSAGMGVGFVTMSSLSTEQSGAKYRMIPIKKFKVERCIRISRAEDHPLTDSERLFWQCALGMEWRGVFSGFNTVPDAKRLPVKGTE